MSTSHLSDTGQAVSNDCDGQFTSDDRFKQQMLPRISLQSTERHHHSTSRLAVSIDAMWGADTRLSRVSRGGLTKLLPVRFSTSAPNLQTPE